ncbi:MAG: DNA helicase II / ATP-dependent DNA helicase PcrA [Candidatus Saganbacteria bacterium]|uniref:DNA 3'-5' helicase n=1 Tax=Candidatus Saganbacteria bacterium TaxID=2575572 RepID=A0A833KZK3_UNCSA|nr:MAG: DNA helicase II / ATP-dependent DNA helicase PcrA [Candidatus Saganbacteria bacterium]
MSQRYILKTAFPTAANYKINYDDALTEEQLPIVKSGKGAALVIAGAGSGKTRTVTYRVAYLVESGVPLENILLLTFTNKASKEMIFRVEGLLKANLNGLWAGTFHHVGNLILRKHAKKLGYNKNFTIMDRGDSKDLLDRSIKEAGINTQEKKFPKGDVLQDVYSYMNNSQKQLSEVIESKYPHLFEMQTELKVVFSVYEETKKKQNLMDFDDLLIKWLELLLQHEDVLQEFSERFEHILVDEYQDTNTIQAQVIDLLASRHGNLMVVGDDSQSIYSFRAAEFRNIIDFPKKYQNCQIFKIETNHRSTPEILNLANDSIKNAAERFEKNLKAIRKTGSQPAVISFRDVYKQAAFVAQRMLELNDEGMKLSDMAVLYRSHYHCLELQMELTRRGIPFDIRSGMRLWEEAHIKDVTSYLKIFHNPHDGLSWLRILKLIPSVGQKTAEKIWKKIQAAAEPIETFLKKEIAGEASKAGQEGLEKAQKLILRIRGMTENPSAMIETILDSGYGDYLRMNYANYNSRREELEELGNYALEYISLEKFLSALALVGGTSAEEIVSAGSGEKEAVVLTTVHQAKGLEWKTVFVIWLAEGRFPSYLSFGSEKEIEEERRLFYVAVTRSKDQLYLAYPVVYQSREGSIVMKASRFIKELSEHRYEKWLVEEEEEKWDDF